MKERGFTMLEIIAVLVLLGILSAMAIGKVGGTRGEARAVADTLKTHLRQAQIRAMHSDTSWGIRSTGSAYWLFSDGNTANKAIFLGENADTVSLTAGVGVTSFTLSFDDWGAPYNGDDPDTGALLATPMSITVSDSSDTATITVTPNTGFIP